MRKHNPTTVYYDGSCPLCVREIDYYRRQAGADGVDWCDVSELPEDAEIEPGVDRDAAMRRLHVRDANGELVSGGRAFIALWQRLPRFAGAGRLLEKGPLPTLLEAGYRAFLMLRPLMQRAARAAFPAPDARS